jgi:hypothetical protein
MGSLVVLAVGIVGRPDALSRRLLARAAMTTARTFGHNLCHVVTHAIAASTPADQI